MRAQSGVPVDSDGRSSRAAPSAHVDRRKLRRQARSGTGAATDDSLPVTYSIAGALQRFSINGIDGRRSRSRQTLTMRARPAQFTVIATDAAGNASEQAVALESPDVDEAALTLVSAAVNGTSLVLTYRPSRLQHRTRRIGVFRSGATTPRRPRAAQSWKWRDGHAHAGDHCRIRANDHGQLRRARRKPDPRRPGNNAAALTAQAVTNSTASVFCADCSRPAQRTNPSGHWTDGIHGPAASSGRKAVDTPVVETITN